MKSLIILSLVIPLLLLFLVNTSNADTADIWKLCQSSTECYYCLTYYCTQDTGSWGWRTFVNPDRCGGNSDGWYCSGNVRENRDYKCNTGGSCTSSGGCTYTVSSSENCITKTSTDTDGGNVPLTAGTVTDYTGCTDGSCTSSSYSDSCSANTLTEYYPNGASYSSQTYNCESYESLYCNTGNGDIYRDEWQCSGGRCNNGSTDTLAQDCSNTCSDSDGGIVYTTLGTATDNNLCSAGQTSCSSSTYTDSCSGNTLTEYYCSGNDYASTPKNCNDYDSVTYDTTADTCSWNDYGCSSGACSSSSSNSLDCDSSDSVSGSTANDYEVSATSCTLGCTDTGCCYIDNTPTSCSTTTSCQSTTVEGTSYKCHRSNAAAWQWDSGTLPAETACSDGYDNDCDGLIDNSDPTNCDSTPPTGSITINSGATYTTSTSVTLTLSCTDTSGCSQMKFSNDDSTWSTPETYATSKAWTLTSGDGTKTVYVRFKDVAGNWMTSSVTDSIILDTTPPSSLVSALDSCRSSTSFTVSWSGSDTGSGLANYDIQYKKNVGSWTDCLASTTSTTTTFPSGCSSPPTVANGDTFYFQSRARDNAGNVEAYPGGNGDASTTIDQSGPNSPTNLQPPTNTLTSDNTPSFSWDSPTDNGCSSIAGYNIQITTASDCSSGIVQESFPTSTSYTATTLLDGVYYWHVKAKDALNNWGSWSSCNRIQVDTTVSAGISINTPPNDILTNTQSVTLYLTYPVDKDKCRYSNDGVWDTEIWETCTSTKSWTLTSGYETKTVYYQVRDLAGNIGQASDSIDYVPNPSYLMGEVNVEGTIDFLHISWNVTGFRTRDLVIDCKLNCDPRIEDCTTAQGCNIQQKQGTGGCTITSPSYDFTIPENKVVCAVSYKDNPTINKTVNREFKLIDFDVSAASAITATIGEQTEVRITIKNKGILQDSYDLTASVISPYADRIILRESSIATGNVNSNEITTASFFITALADVPGSPSLRITIASSVYPSISKEVSIQIKTVELVLGLPEFHFLGLLQIIFLALILLYFRM